MTLFGEQGASEVFKEERGRKILSSSPRFLIREPKETQFLHVLVSEERVLDGTTLSC